MIKFRNWSKWSNSLSWLCYRLRVLESYLFLLSGKHGCLKWKPIVGNYLVEILIKD